MWMPNHEFLDDDLLNKGITQLLKIHKKKKQKKESLNNSHQKQQ